MDEKNAPENNDTGKLIAALNRLEKATWALNRRRRRDAPEWVWMGAGVILALLFGPWLAQLIAR